ncbi:IclR family transcriptional regulator [Nitratireductor soli]|uniref:IclR family transcriptional regulator n=1 Tax=Nitratireductor soli TaxID=1670619 RepID=UPI00065DD4C2|nr:IclR family transcriptional regulator [Nitratireductor soli]
MGIVKSEQEHNIRGVGLLHKAFQILELFSPEQPGWTQVEIGRAADLPRSTVSRLVRYLCVRGYLSFHERSGRYTLGFSAIELGRRAQSQLDLAAFAEDILEELARKTRETVMLTGFNPAALHVVCLAQIPSQHGVLRVYETVGATFPLYAGASTKPVLAHLPENITEHVLASPMPPINPEWVPRPELLRADLEQTRVRGFAVSFEETYPGVAGVGAAILGPDGRPLGSLAVAAPLQRMSRESIEELGHAVSDAARTLSARLGGDAVKQETGAQR